ncbi:MAG: hypothetical protein AAF468_00675 [Pseudomonadota bacterium]
MSENNGTGRLSERGSAKGVLATVFLAAFLLAGEISAHAASLSVAEDEIVSLANAPAVGRIIGYRDEAGASVISMTLTYANPCAAEVSSDVRYVETANEQVLLFVLPKFSEQGCPDIFDPVAIQTLVLVPSLDNVESVRVVARPIEGLPLDVTPTDAPGSPSDAVHEAKPLFSDERVVGIDYVRLTPSEGAGYSLSGDLGISPSCATKDIRTRLFEVPNADGGPNTDVLVVHAPGACRTSGDFSPATINVQTPQSGAGRTLFFVNSGETYSLGR